MAINRTDLQFLDQAFRKLLTSTGIKDGLFEDVFTNISKAQITEPLTLYVETTGDDVNGSGTKNSPYRTIQKALDYIEGYEIGAGVTINIGSGNFDGFVLKKMRFISVQNSSVFLNIQGTEIVVDSGNLTNSSGTLDQYRTFTDSSKNWTPNSLRGMTVSDITSGNRFIICENTATTFTVLTSSSFIGNSYSIFKNSTIIDGVSVTSPSGYPFSANSTVSSKILAIDAFGENQFATSQYSLTNLHVKTTTNGSALLIRGESYLQILNCVFENISGGGTLLANTVGKGAVALSRCYFVSGATATVGINGTNNGASSAHPFSVSQCVFSVSSQAIGLQGSTHNVSTCYFLGSSSGLQLSRFSECTINSCRFLGQTFAALYIESPSICLWSGENRFDSCSTAILCLGKFISFASGTSVKLTGSGNGIGLSCTLGGKVQVSPASTLTGTTEISVDGVSSSLSTMRSNSPKIFPTTANPYGSYIFE